MHKALVATLIAVASTFSCEEQSTTKKVDLNNPDRAQLMCEVEIEKRLKIQDLDMDFSASRESTRLKSTKDGVYFVTGWFRTYSGRRRRYECQISFTGEPGGDHWQLVKLTLH